jgi:uncharacterized protein
MRIIDADTHVDETEDTWEFLRADEQAYKPTTGFPPNPDPSRPPARYWVVDGRRHLRFIRDDVVTRTTAEKRELMDVPGRLADMDAMGVETQVIYPTLFLVEVTEQPEVDLALRRSYNRWLGARCEESKGRLRWVCLPPTQNLPQALEELRWAKDHGAVGLMKKGDREAGKWPGDPYFFPLYAEAERLDLPICFHVGSGVVDSTPAREFPLGRFMHIGMPPLHAFHSIVQLGVAARFPKLRFGFIEARSTWVPFVLYDLKRTLKKRVEVETRLSAPVFEVPANVLQANRLYVSIQVDEDLRYILEHTGEDNLLIGSDYTHADASAEMDFPRLLQARADAGDIPQSAVQKILYDNPRRFYGL